MRVPVDGYIFYVLLFIQLFIVYIFVCVIYVFIYLFVHMPDIIPGQIMIIIALIMQLYSDSRLSKERLRTFSAQEHELAEQQHEKTDLTQRLI